MANILLSKILRERDFIGNELAVKPSPTTTIKFGELGEIIEKTYGLTIKSKKIKQNSPEYQKYFSGLLKLNKYDSNLK